MLFFLFWRYRHFPSFLYLIKKCLEEIMALLHNNGKVLKSWHTYVFQKFYKKRWYTKSTDTHIQIQKTMFLTPFRLYETLTWKTVKAMKQLRFFKTAKNSEAVQLMPFSPGNSSFKGVSKQQCHQLNMNYAHIKIHCPIQVLIWPNSHGISQDFSSTSWDFRQRELK